MWRTVKLGEVLELQNGYAFKSKEYSQDGFFVMRITNVQQGYISAHNPKYIQIASASKLAKFILEEGDILVSLTGDMGRVGVIREEHLPAALNQRVARVQSVDASLDSHFLFHYLNSAIFRNQVEALGKGAAQANVSTKEILEITLELPPLAEQERIVAKLDAAFAEIDEAISSAESKESEVQALKTSILSKLLNNKSNGWESSYLEGVSSFISRGISPKYLESGGVRVLNQKCIRNHRINYDLARRHDIDLKKVSEERFIRLGDILINSTGQGTLGRVAQVRKEPDELTTIDSHITIVRPKSEIFYLDYFGYAAIAIEKIIQDAGQGTSGQTELAKSKVQNDFQICFPRSFSDQEAEVKKLDIVFEEIEIALKNLTKSKTNLYALKSAILSQELQSSEAA